MGISAGRDLIPAQSRAVAAGALSRREDALVPVHALLEQLRGISANRCPGGCQISKTLVSAMGTCSNRL